MANHKCPECPIRAKYDADSTSFVGRFWRWHINFCPGWKAYFKSLSPEQQEELRSRYSFTRYRQQ